MDEQGGLFRPANLPNEDDVWASNVLDTFRQDDAQHLRDLRLIIRVHGTPAPQGSKRAVMHKATGRAVVIESSKKVKPWREAVKFAALEERHQSGVPDHQTLEGPVEVGLWFYLARPKGHFGTGRNAGVVKESAPDSPAVRPDIDKLARSTLDGLKDGGVYQDDAQIVSLTVVKRYAFGSEGPGVVVAVGRA